MEVIVVGCGPSSSVPSMRCILSETCAVCLEAHRNPRSKNRRLNPSLLVRNLTTNTNVLIDCGKTFREAALSVFPQVGISTVQALLLTHDHADAMLGMDDLREVQAHIETIDPVTHEVYKIPPEPIPVHCSEATSDQVRVKFPYLLDTQAQNLTTKDANTPFRWTAKLQLAPFQAWEPFQACGLTFLAFPVIHGAGYTSFGFEFGAEVGARVVYISDVSELPDETKRFLHDSTKPQIDLFIIDALYLEKYHSTHMNLHNVMEALEQLKPKRTLLTGMSHEFDYSTHSLEVPKMGNKRGLNLEMAYDGLQILFDRANAMDN